MSINYVDRMFQDINLELQSNCNRNCWFCPRPYDRSGTYFTPEGNRIVEQMPTEQLNKLLDQLEEIEFPGKISLHHLSEPALDKRMIEIARDIKRRGMRAVINTNGDLFRNNEKLCQEAVEVFDHIVVGIYDQSDPVEVEREKAYWLERLKGTDVYFSVIMPEDAEAPASMRAFPRTSVPYDERMSVPKNTYPNGKCHRPVERFLIKYNGSVAICCEDHMSSFELGNVFETPIMDIYMSKKRLEIVKNLMEGKRSMYPLCSACSMPPTKAPKGEEGEPLYREKY